MQVIASRKELVEYDRQQREAASAAAAALPPTTPATPLDLSGETLFAATTAATEAVEVAGCGSAEMDKPVPGR